MYCVRARVMALQTFCGEIVGSRAKDGGGGGKTGSICHFAFSHFLQCLGASVYQDAGKNSTKSLTINPGLESSVPKCSRQSTGKMTN